MVAVNTLEITVLLEEVIVMFMGALARAGLPVESWSCTAKSLGWSDEFGSNTICPPPATTAEREEGAGMTVEMSTEEVRSLM